MNILTELTAISEAIEIADLLESEHNQPVVFKGVPEEKTNVIDEYNDIMQQERKYQQQKVKQKPWWKC